VKISVQTPPRHSKTLAGQQITRLGVKISVQTPPRHSKTLAGQQITRLAFELPKYL
jgi:hypothetical protein